MNYRLKKRESEIGWKLNSDSSPFAEGPREVEILEGDGNVSIIFMSVAGALVLGFINAVEAMRVSRYKRTHHKRGQGYQWWKPWQEN